MGKDTMALTGRPYSKRLARAGLTGLYGICEEQTLDALVQCGADLQRRDFSRDEYCRWRASVQLAAGTRYTKRAKPSATSIIRAHGTWARALDAALTELRRRRARAR